jgi:hypothetical protein
MLSDTPKHLQTMTVAIIKIEARSQPLRTNAYNNKGVSGNT